MHIAIDILAAIILLFFFLSGWHKGTLLSLLGVARVVVAYSAAYLAGRYLGYWLGAATHRPRFITIPIVAIFTFALVGFIFRIIMHNIRRRHREKAKQENYQLSALSCFTGGTINLTAGIFTLALLFWLGDLFMVGMTGHSLPGTGRAYFERFTRRTVYEISHAVIPGKGHEAQAAALARLISNPARGLEHLKNLLATDSVQQIRSDPELAKALLSGDAERIQNNASMQRLFNDREALDELRELGFVSGYESRSGLCHKLAAVGRNETIRSSLENLQEKDLLSPEKITRLIRDPDFDAIVAELVR